MLPYRRRNTANIATVNLFKESTQKELFDIAFAILEDFNINESSYDKHFITYEDVLGLKIKDIHNK